MTLIIILACVFACIALMVVLGERYGKPMSEDQQKSYGKIIPILVFASLFIALIKFSFF